MSATSLAGDRRTTLADDALDKFQGVQVNQNKGNCNSTIEIKLRKPKSEGFQS